MSKYWLDWNSWGTGEIKDLSDRIEPVGGGLCKKTENMGDGRWSWCTGKMDESIVRGMRRLYNQGRHSKAAATPNTPVTAWSGDGVTPATFRIRRAKTATA